uniref:Calcineurin-like phosphoesterase domain-containing protein n=1 Tax=Phaselicystis flava TaxID=525924 RepID=A0A3S7V097_9BACT|nr:hypothetical protein [Phaselicystis flava]
MRHTVVISDVHLSEVERESGPWMRYRQRAHLPDGPLAAMLDELRARIREERARGTAATLTLVLNGDVFDFDAPRVVGEQSVFHDLPRTAEHSVPALAAILRDHPVFVGALGRVLADGHELVLISGNHDVQITLPEVRALLVANLVEAAVAVLAAEGRPRGPSIRAALRARVVFRAWFHRTPDGIVIEHGHQYDPTCAYRTPMDPFGRRPREIHPTLGSLGTRCLVSRFGYVNPHDDRSFMLPATAWIAHWARHYALSRRSLVIIWLSGMTRIFSELVRGRHALDRARRRAAIREAARETGAPLGAVARHARLFARPMEERLYDAARQLWVDRVGVAALALLIGAGLLFALSGPLKLVGLAAAPALIAAWEWIAPRGAFNAAWTSVDRTARHIARIHRARAVVFGHTHLPGGRWEGDVFLGNSGTWSAIPEAGDPACVPRAVIWLVSEEGAPSLRGGLYVWASGRFHAMEVREAGDACETSTEGAIVWADAALPAAASVIADDRDPPSERDDEDDALTPDDEALSTAARRRPRSIRSPSAAS